MTELVPTIEVTTSEPNAALYFVCQNRHPLAVRTTTTTENGVRRGGHHEIVCPACEADGITEVRLPDLDDDVPERERLVHENPELAEQIREGIAQAERGETVDLGSFGQHLDEGDDDG